jgi:hypothetical protein
LIAMDNRICRPRAILQPSRHGLVLGFEFWVLGWVIGYVGFRFLFWVGRQVAANPKSGPQQKTKPYGLKPLPKTLKPKT